MYEFIDNIRSDFYRKELFKQRHSPTHLRNDDFIHDVCPISPSTHTLHSLISLYRFHPYRACDEALKQHHHT